ncbi:MAG TPA: DUF433 domain-containing protein [Chloroflexota bacterium]|nr:DUF433 domain-containing protein [Chloroflexota bacterium]
MISHPYVSETLGINGGYPVVRGTRTPVRVIVKFFRQTHNLEQVHDLLPHLTMEELRGALDYYERHPERVDEDIERNDRAWAELQSRPWPV